MAMPEILPYPGGLSRGDTPPKEIPTTGAGGKRNPHPLREEDVRKGKPYWCDETLRCPARHEGMSLDNVKNNDCPKGPLLYTKDYDLSLTTSDLFKAQPVLAHRASGNSAPLPWKCLEKEVLEEVPFSRPKTFYPEVQLTRPKDLSLTTSDIEFAQPKQKGYNSENFLARCERASSTTDGAVDPLRPTYRMLSSEAVEYVPLRTSGKCTLDVSDIEHTAPAMQIPYRREYRDPLKCEDEFRSRHWRAMKSTAASTPRSGASSARADPIASLDQVQGGALSSTAQASRPRRRQENPLDPRYLLPLSGPCTSVHARWAEERMTEGSAPPPVEHVAIGHIEGSTTGSKPGTRIRENGEPQLSLETGDIYGATNLKKVAGIPYSIYGPFGARPAQSQNLNSLDIEGAQAGTLAKGPRPTHYHPVTQALRARAIGNAIVNANAAPSTPRTPRTPQAEHPNLRAGPWHVAHAANQDNGGDFMPQTGRVASGSRPPPAPRQPIPAERG